MPTTDLEIDGTLVDLVDRRGGGDDRLTAAIWTAAVHVVLAAFGRVGRHRTLLQAGEHPTVIVDQLAPATSSFRDLLTVTRRHLESASSAASERSEVDAIVAVRSRRWLQATAPLIVSVDGARLHVDGEAPADTLAAIAASIVDVVRRGLMTPGVIGSDIDLVGPETRAELRSLGTGTAVELPLSPFDMVVHAAAAHPGDVALIDSTGSVRYGELVPLVEQAAEVLETAGVLPGSRVGLVLDRNNRRSIQLLAVARLRATAVPLNKALPTAVLTGMVQRCGLTAIVGEEHGSFPIAEMIGGPSSVVGSVCIAVPAAATTTAPTAHVSYVVHTSGTTGRPKSVAMTNLGLGNLLDWHGRALPSRRRTLHLASLSFDVGLQEVWSTLAVGGTLVSAPQQVRDNLSLLAPFLAEHAIERTFLTPALLEALADHALAADLRLAIREIISAGDRLVIGERLGRFLDTLPAVELHNQYGPSETTSAVANYVVPGHGGRWPARPSIGSVVQNCRLSVVDRHLRPLPIGIGGELIVGGPSLSDGYLGDPRVTARSFVPDPDGPPGSRAYRTGDLVAWTAGGDLTFIGRVDHQIKLRGHRIELVEVEAAFRRHPAVERCVVLPLRSADRVTGLHAFVAVGHQEVDRGDLVATVADQLAEYQIPGQITILPSLPLNANGKVDRSALVLDTGAAMVAPEPILGLEGRLCAIWQSVLGTVVTSDSNFYALGGDSIAALQVVSRALEEGLAVEALDVLEHPTVGALTPFVTAVGDVEPVTAPTYAEAPVTSVQRWFLESDRPHPSHFNLAFHLALEPDVDLDVLEKALTAVVGGHHAFRTAFVPTPDGWRQRFADAPRFALERLTVVHRTDATADLDRAQRSLDLLEGPIARGSIVDATDGRSLFLVVHHLIADTVSWHVLLGDLEFAYAEVSAGRAAVVRPALAHAELAGFEQTRGAEVATDVEVVAHWTDPARASGGTLVASPGVTGAGTIRRELSVDTRGASTLRDRGRAATVSAVETTLTCAVVETLRETTGHAVWLINVEGHGRFRRGGPDLSRTVGWTTVMCPVLIGPLDADPSAAFRTVERLLVAAADDAEPYGLLVGGPDHETGRAVRDANPFQVTVNYLGQLDRHSAGRLFDGTVAPLPAGDDRPVDACPLFPMYVGAHLDDGGLQVALELDRRLFTNAAADDLTAALGLQLRRLVDGHATGVVGTTPEQFPYANLSQGQLDDVMARLRRTHE